MTIPCCPAPLSPPVTHTRPACLPAVLLAAVAESSGACGSPATVSKPSPGTVAGAAAAAASPLCFTLTMPSADASNFGGGQEEQQRQLLAAFGRALPGEPCACQRQAAAVSAEVQRAYIIVPFFSFVCRG